MAAKDNLQRLNARLNSIMLPNSTTPEPNSSSPKIKIEEDIIDATLNKFVCAECGQSFHRVGFLAHHYTRLHTQAGFVCTIPDCGVPCVTMPSLTRHRNKKHAGQYKVCQYPGCTKQFNSWSRLTQHFLSHSAEAEMRGYYICLYGDSEGKCDCEGKFPDLIRLTQHAYQAHPGVSVASSCLECHERFPTDQALCQHYRTFHPFPSGIKLICPAPNCSESFSSVDDLYLHYENSRHPSYIPNQQPRHLAFKCPFEFCARAYSSEIGLGIHNALAHGSEIGGLTVFTLPSASLVMERDSGHPESSNDGDDMESVIEIDEEGAVLLPDELSKDVEPDEIGNPSPHSHKLKIGFILNNHPSFDDPDEPVHYQHAGGSSSDHGHNKTGFSVESLAREIFKRILLLLRVDDKISVVELLELWTVFLQPDQRQYVIEQLTRFNIFEEPENLVVGLRGSGLSDVILAWIRFKSLLDQTPPHLHNAIGHPIHSPGRDTMWIILMHCMLLEDLRAHGLRTRVELGFDGIPDRLHFPTQGYDISGPDASFDQVLDALIERVKCRKALPEWIYLTTDMVLTEIPNYLAELKEVVLALNPGHYNKEWLEFYGIDLVE